MEGRAPFPVLQAAQIRMGVRVTPNAIRRNESESAPPKRVTGRWPKSVIAHNDFSDCTTSVSL